jgi:hypothetical protein
VELLLEGRNSPVGQAPGLTLKYCNRLRVTRDKHFSIFGVLVIYGIEKF